VSYLPRRVSYLGDGVAHEKSRISTALSYPNLRSFGVVFDGGAKWGMVCQRLE
jgi:hypothetical protein